MSAKCFEAYAHSKIIKVYNNKLLAHYIANLESIDRNVRAELYFIIRRHLPTSFSDMLGTSIPNKNMTSILGKGRMFSHKPKIFWLSRMEATKSNVFQTIEIVMAWSCRYLE